MTKSEREILERGGANGLARWDGPTASWIHARKDGPSFYTMGGHKIPTPKEWRDLSVDQIVAEMDSRGEIPVG